MKVFVRNQDGAPLMPCTPAKARKLLRAGKARVVAHTPFTIQLEPVMHFGLERGRLKV
jgi:hypothetical protein